MQTPDGEWRVEVVRQRDQQWLQVVHDGVTIEYLTPASVAEILERAGVDMGELVPVEL
jgi:hypothetical protein